MNAFVKTERGLFKIYRRGDEWQVVGPDGFERWCSVWSADPRGSLQRAIGIAPGLTRDAQIISVN